MNLAQATQSIAHSATSPAGTSGAQNASTAFWVIVAVWLIVWVVLFVVCCMWEGRRVIGPIRLDPRLSAWPVAGIALAGIATFILIPNFYVGYRLSRRMAIIHASLISPTTAPAGASVPVATTVPATQPALQFSPLENVALGAVEEGGAFLVMVGLYLLLRPRGLNELGLRGKEHGRFLRGSGAGLVGFILLLPVILVVGYFVQEIYTRLHYQHPEAHELLLTLGGASNHWLQALIIVEAVVLAPLFEELFFRGHAQTLLLRLFSLRYIRQFRPRRNWETSAAGFSPYLPPLPTGETPATFLPQTAEGQQMPAPAQVLGGPGTGMGIAARWGAIVLTAIFFAMMHTPWERPEIFFLALCLGYAYERTGNLWTNIMMHACFNGIMVLFFLGGLSG